MPHHVRFKLTKFTSPSHRKFPIKLGTFSCVSVDYRNWQCALKQLKLLRKGWRIWKNRMICRKLGWHPCCFCSSVASVPTNFSAFIRLPFPLITSVAGRKRQTRIIYTQRKSRARTRPTSSSSNNNPSYLHQISERVCVCVCVLYFNEIIKIALSVLRRASDVFRWGNMLCFCHFPVGFSASSTV